MKTVSVKGEGGSILIDVLGYEREHASNKSDANWLSSSVKIDVNPFSGQVNLALTTQDFAMFYDSLTKILNELQGKATFQTPEEGLEFTIEMKSLGNALIKGYARDTIGRAKLGFEFNTDQSYLAETHKMLSALINAFPVK